MMSLRGSSKLTCVMDDACLLLLLQLLQRVAERKLFGTELLNFLLLTG